MPERAIDLNADLGEGIGDDFAMLDTVTSANISCGLHAGDPVGIAATVRAAADRGIVIGAHVSYPDREHFGRLFLDMPSAELTAAVTYQLGALGALCRAAGTRPRYVKPHGALYHAITTREEQARAVITAITRYDAPLTLLGLTGSVAFRMAEEEGITCVAEAFVDRAYARDASLVPRGEPGAVLEDPDAVAARAVDMIRTGATAAITGERVSIAARSLCVHGDTPGAVAMARAVRSGLEAAGIELRPFAEAPPWS